MPPGNPFKTIVFSGHGKWAYGNDGYVSVPAKCRIRFYTLNMRSMSDTFGGKLDRGVITGVEPEQEAGPLMTVPNMRLYEPEGLTIKMPDDDWHVLKFGDPLNQHVPADDKDIQVQIYGDSQTGVASAVRGRGPGNRLASQPAASQPPAKTKELESADLKTLFEFLDPAIHAAKEVVFVWAACRLIKLRGTGLENNGINSLQQR